MSNAHILLVEDNDGDILLTKEAFDERKIIQKISVVRNGEDAIDFLLKQGKFKDAERPDLILLDINLPTRNGHEVLVIIKSHEHLRKIPTIMLTTSASKKDIENAYYNHANSYILKPLEMEEFMTAIRKIEEFWLNLSQLAEE